MSAQRARRWSSVALVATVVVITSTLGCGGEAPDVGQVEAKVSFDRSVMKFIRRFNVAILETRTKDKSPVTCADIPKPYQFGSKNLTVVANKSIRWEGQQSEAKFPTVVVPAGQPLLISVQGEVPWPAPNSVHVVARGCEEGVSYGRGEDKTLRVNATATVGKPCNSLDDCEPTLTACLQGQLFEDGYCTVAGCTDNAECPPGSHCVLGQDKNFCARLCQDSAGDCETGSGQACLGRVGVSGCARVCVHPNWNKGADC